MNVDERAANFLNRIKRALDYLEAGRLSEGEKLLALRAAQSDIAKRFVAVVAGDESGRSRFIEVRM